MEVIWRDEVSTITFVKKVIFGKDAENQKVINQTCMLRSNDSCG